MASFRRSQEACQIEVLVALQGFEVVGVCDVHELSVRGRSRRPFMNACTGE